MKKRCSVFGVWAVLAAVVFLAACRQAPAPKVEPSASAVPAAAPVAAPVVTPAPTPPPRPETPKPVEVVKAAVEAMKPPETPKPVETPKAVETVSAPAPKPAPAPSLEKPKESPPPPPPTPVPAPATPTVAAVPSSAPVAPTTAAPAAAVAPVKAKNEILVLHLAKGDVRIDLFEADAPAHAENLKRLVRSGFLNGTVFHRVCPGFIQGGDPTGKGDGGVGTPIPAEIKRPHVRGSLVAARKPDDGNPKKDSHGSQFFIMKQPYQPFDGQYTVFGQVTSGLELLDAIADGVEQHHYLVSISAQTKILRADIVAE